MDIPDPGPSKGAAATINAIHRDTPGFNSERDTSCHTVITEVMTGVAGESW